LAGVVVPDNTPGARLLKTMESISQSTSKPAEVILYGAGKYTARLLSQRELWQCKGHRVVGLIDDHPRFIEQTMCFGLPVQSIKSASEQLQDNPHFPPVILSTDTYQDHFWMQNEPVSNRGVIVHRLH
jgi:hypothetical protein